MSLFIAIKNKINKRYGYLLITGAALFAFSMPFFVVGQVNANHNASHSAQQCAEDGGVWDDNRCNMDVSESEARQNCEDAGGQWLENSRSCTFGSGVDRRELCPGGGSFDEENNQCTSQDEALAIGDSADESLIEKYVNPLIAFLAAVVGLVVTISIVIGGIQYSSAGSDPQKVAKAKGRIVNALIALLTFLFLFTLLEWIIPGGLIN